MSDSIEEQLANLRKIAAPQYIGRVKVGCLAMTVLVVGGFLAAGYLLKERNFFILALMLGAVGLSTLRAISKEQTPLLANARQALECFDSVTGSVRIVVEEDDSSKVYRASAPDQAGNNWMFPFNPEGWSPQTGDYMAELRYIEGVAWPSLVITNDGILHPQFNPKQERLALPEEEAAEAAASRGHVLLGVILVVAAVGWSLIMWNVYRLDARILESGVAVEAEVVKVGHLRPKRDENCCLVYRFTLPGGRVMERTWHEEEGRWKAYRPGDRILIRYHPDDPERQLVEGRVGTSLGVAILFILLPGLLFLGIGVALIVPGIRKLRRSK